MSVEYILHELSKEEHINATCLIPVICNSLENVNGMWYSNVYSCWGILTSMIEMWCNCDVIMTRGTLYCEVRQRVLSFILRIDITRLGSWGLERLLYIFSHDGPRVAINIMNVDGGAVWLYNFLFNNVSTLEDRIPNLTNGKPLIGEFEIYYLEAIERALDSGIDTMCNISDSLLADEYTGSLLKAIDVMQRNGDICGAVTCVRLLSFCLPRRSSHKPQAAAANGAKLVIELALKLLVVEYLSRCSCSYYMQEKCISTLLSVLEHLVQHVVTNDHGPMLQDDGHKILQGLAVKMMDFGKNDLKLRILEIERLLS